MSRRKATQDDVASDEPLLSPKQELAADLLATGPSGTAAAEACGVARQTVSESLNSNNAFKAALNRRRQELWTESADRVRSFLPKALDVLAEELAGEKRLVAAVHIVKAVGLYGLSSPAGPTDPKELEAEEKSKRFELMLRQGFG